MPAADPAGYVSYTNDPVPESTYESIAEQVASSLGSTDPVTTLNTVGYEILWSMKARHAMYYLWENNAPPPQYQNGVLVQSSPCGTPGGLNLGSLNAIKLAGVATQGAGAAASAGIKIATSLGAAASSDGGVLTSVLGDVAGFAGLALLPLSIISGIEAHHAQAVQTEQQTLCNAVPQANAAIDLVDQSFYNGTLAIDEAEQDLQTILGAFEAAVASIRKQCDASCFEVGMLQGNVVLRTTFLYPQFAAAIAKGDVVTQQEIAGPWYVAPVGGPASSGALAGTPTNILVLAALGFAVAEAA
jgi:hypothetical protein